MIPIPYVTRFEDLTQEKENKKLNNSGVAKQQPSEFTLSWPLWVSSFLKNGLLKGFAWRSNVYDSELQIQGVREYRFSPWLGN